MSNLKYRIAIIGALLLASAWTLFPRTVQQRVIRNGTAVVDTVRRVPLKRGLDLAGGMYMALEIDESKGTVANKSEALDRALRVVRSRVDEFGVSEPIVQKVGEDRIIVELPGVDDRDRAADVVKKSAFLQFQITDKTGALERSLPRIDNVVRSKAPAGSAAARPQAAPSNTALGGLLKSADTALTQSVGDSTKRVASADSAARDTGALGAAAATGGPFSRLIQAGQIPGQYIVPATAFLEMQQYLSYPEVQGAMPPGKVIRWGADSIVAGNNATYRTLYVLDARPIITGDYLRDAKPVSDPVEGNLVTFELSAEGGRRFKNETGRHIKDNMAVVLDDRVITAPTIQSSIGRNGQITLGGASLQAAQDLALVLRAGALPVPLKIAETREIGASLGQDSINKGIIAGIIAVGLVIMTMATLAGFDAVLTLPGLAGFVLSIGIAVDANVLIFERIREELDQGKSPRLAIDEGFRHAMSAIVDSNVSTALTAAVLYQFGTGPVRGFAVTLLAGIAASMITSIFVVKTFYMLWLSRSSGTETVSI
jgi:preprotein translocase subunit SecD